MVIEATEQLTPDDVLKKTAEFLKENRWVNHPGNMKEEFCVLQAISVVSGHHDNFNVHSKVSELFINSCDLLRNRIGLQNIPSWNDSLNVNQFDLVLRVLEGE